MKTRKGQITIAGAALLLSAGPVLAGENMSMAQLDALLTGNTLYINVPAGTPGAPDGGIAPIRYAADGSAVAVLPAGLKLTGQWRIKGDFYCIDWENGPKNSCTRLVRTSSGYTVVDTAKDEPRGTVERIVPGNPENL